MAVRHLSLLQLDYNSHEVKRLLPLGSLPVTDCPAKREQTWLNDHTITTFGRFQNVEIHSVVLAFEPIVHVSKMASASRGLDRNRTAAR